MSISLLSSNNKLVLDYVRSQQETRIQYSLLHCWASTHATKRRITFQLHHLTCVKLLLKMFPFQSSARCWGNSWIWSDIAVLVSRKESQINKCSKKQVPTWLPSSSNRNTAWTRLYCLSISVCVFLCSWCIYRIQTKSGVKNIFFSMLCDHDLLAESK